MDSSSEAKVKALEDEIAALKQQLSQVAIDETKKSSRDYSTTKYKPKNPLGMKDYPPAESQLRESVIGMIKEVFRMHGGQPIETPVAELKATLTGNYGEDAEEGETKLIYDLKDQGGELLSLRYDLTVPFARFCAQNKIESIKRYQVAKVYRRDRPNVQKGRLREFFQCDFDIAGTYESMTVDAECLSVLSHVFQAVNVKFCIKLNHRGLLDGIFATSKIPPEMFKTTCSSVDKLDKCPWEEVKSELLQKGLTEAQCDKLWEFVQRKAAGADNIGELLKILQADEELKKNCSQALDDVSAVIKYAADLGVNLENIELNLSLARGLDYYTGVIYEVVGTGKESEGVGSMAGGGRYDNLVGRFTRKKKVIPCVGLSIGIERLFSVIANSKLDLNSPKTQVLVCVVGVDKDRRQEFLSLRMKCLARLWAAGIRAETLWKLNPKPLTQFQTAEDHEIPFCLVFGPGEAEKNEFILRETSNRSEKVVPEASLISVLKEKLESH